MAKWIYEEFYFGNGGYPSDAVWRHKEGEYQHQISLMVTDIAEARGLAEEGELIDPYVLYDSHTKEIEYVVGWRVVDRSGYEIDLRDAWGGASKWKKHKKNGFYWSRRSLDAPGI